MFTFYHPQDQQRPYWWLGVLLSFYSAVITAFLLPSLLFSQNRRVHDAIFLPYIASLILEKSSHFRESSSSSFHFTRYLSTNLLFGLFRITSIFHHFNSVCVQPQAVAVARWISKFTDGSWSWCVCSFFTIFGFEILRIVPSCICAVPRYLSSLHSRLRSYQT